VVPAGEYGKKCCIEFFLYSPSVTTVLGQGLRSVAALFYLNTVGSTDGQYCFQLCFGVFFLSMNTITDLAEIFKEC